MRDRPILWTDRVTAGYGDLDIISAVTVRVHAGQIVSVLGPNGAGKSTLLRAIYGLLPKRTGQVCSAVGDLTTDVTGLRPHEITRQGLNYVPQTGDIFPSMSVRENLQIGAYQNWGSITQNLERALDVFPVLKSRLSQKAGSLSGGERRMLAVARALMSAPRVLLLDEPSAGVAPLAASQLFAQLQVLASNGVALLVVEQNAVRALEMSDYAYVLEVGRVRFEGSGRELLKDGQIAELYLGKRGSAPPERA